MNPSDRFSRRTFFAVSSRMAAAGAALTLFDAPNASAAAVPTPPRPVLRPVTLKGTRARLVFGPSPEEANILWGHGIPAGYKPASREETFVFDGEFGIDDAFRLSGAADVILSDGSRGRIEFEQADVRIRYGDDTLLFRDITTDNIEHGDKKVTLDDLYRVLRREVSSKGIAPLSGASRALAIYAAFWHLEGVVANTDAVRKYASARVSDDTDYGWWCEAWAKAGAVAIGILGAVGCALLLAGCVGTVVLDGLGVVSCVAANIICGLISVGLGVLVDVIKELLWAHDDEVTT